MDLRLSQQWFTSGVNLTTTSFQSRPLNGNLFLLRIIHGFVTEPYYICHLNLLCIFAGAVIIFVLLHPPAPPDFGGCTSFAPPLHPLCTPYHRCCTPRLWRCTPLAPPRTLTGVGLWNITDVLEFPSTLMEQRTLDARGVLWYKYYSGGWCTWPTPLKYAESKFKYTEA